MPNETRPTGARPSRPRPASEIEAAFSAGYRRYQYHIVDFIAEHLADASRTFGGDLQTVVLMAIIGQVHLNMEIAGEISGTNVAELPPERRGITTNRLADVTQIPRETVRRKLLSMERRGWLMREQNFWFLAMDGDDSAARRDLAEIDARCLKRAAKLFANLSALTENP